MARKNKKKIGMFTGGLQTVNNAVKSPRQIDPKSLESANQQSQIGGLISGIGGAASMIPGVGTAIGAGLGVIGSLVQATATPNITYLPNQTSTPYGYNTGGQMAGPVNGGQLDPLSSMSQLVNAHQKGTDTVETENAMLDDNEVVSENRVYSSTLNNPLTGRTFADDERTVQKSLGKFEKMQAKTGDVEYKDDKYHKKNSENLFNVQENLAAALGLRNQDGSPTQNTEGIEGMQWGGKKRMANGGPLGDPTKFSTDNLFNIDAGNYMDKFQYSGSQGLPDPVLEQVSMQQMGMNNLNVSENTMNLETPNRTDLSTKTLPPVRSTYGTDPLGGHTPDTVGPESLLDNSSRPQGNQFMEGYFNENPFGNAASLIGIGQNVAGLMANKTNFVGYGDIGAPEIRAQGKALRRIRAGEATAKQQTILQGQAARQDVNARSLQSKNANLRNIASGTSLALGNITGQFAGREAGMLGQFGARRSQIEAANRQKDMQVDDINTREQDALLTQNLRMVGNLRNVALEQQLAYNKYRRNTELEGLLKTQNFEYEYDENGQRKIIFKSGVKTKTKTT